MNFMMIVVIVLCVYQTEIFLLLLTATKKIWTAGWSSWEVKKICWQLKLTWNIIQKKAQIYFSNSVTAVIIIIPTWRRFMCFINLFTDKENVVFQGLKSTNINITKKWFVHKKNYNINQTKRHCALANKKKSDKNEKWFSILYEFYSGDTKIGINEVKSSRVTVTVR